MMEQFNSYILTNVEQGILFTLAALLSMGYHYLDHYIKTHTRLLDTPERIWNAINTLGTMLVGSTAWTHFYGVTNFEIVLAGIGVGLAAFSKGLHNIESGK